MRRRRSAVLFAALLSVAPAASGQSERGHRDTETRRIGRVFSVSPCLGGLHRCASQAVSTFTTACETAR